MMIFDKFPDFEKACAFASHVRQRYDLNVAVFTCEAWSQMVDVFPLQLFPPIVLVDRTGTNTEIALHDQVKSFGGAFTGT